MLRRKILNVFVAFSIIVQVGLFFSLVYYVGHGFGIAYAKVWLRICPTVAPCDDRPIRHIDAPANCSSN